MNALQLATPDVPQAGLPPPLKWAGGKRWLVGEIAKYWAAAPGRRLVEPFAGGLAVALGLRPARALLNDLNPHLYNFYVWLKRGLRTDAPFENVEATYYQNRDRFNELVRRGRGNTAEAAALFYYLNRTGYNGLCRFNRSGGFNVPFGRYARITYRRDFTDYRSQFAHWELANTPATELPLEKDDFVYADPPYDGTFTNYSAGGFSWEDQQAIARRLTTHPGPVLLSNSATPRIVELYEGLGYSLVLLPAPRRISCTGDRSPAREVLAFRNLKP